MPWYTSQEDKEEVQEDLACANHWLEESGLRNMGLFIIHEESLLSMVRFAIAGALAGEYQPEELPQLLREWCKLAGEELPGFVQFGLEN